MNEPALLIIWLCLTSNMDNKVWISSANKKKRVVQINIIVV